MEWCDHCNKEIELADPNAPPAWGEQMDFHIASKKYQCMSNLGQYLGTFATRKEKRSE